jgi:hypothetical protein
MRLVLLRLGAPRDHKSKNRRTTASVGSGASSSTDPPPRGKLGASRSFIANLSTCVPAGTPLNENGGDFGSKHFAVPSSS